MPNMILLPRAAEELKIPFVASGGMADARSLVAALAIGVYNFFFLEPRFSFVIGHASDVFTFAIFIAVARSPQR